MSAQLIGVDLDQGPSVDSLRQMPFIQAHAFLIYATPSSTPAAPRSRIFFRLDQPITSLETYRQLVVNLLGHLQSLGLQPDPSCKDGVRMFYGSTQPGHWFSPDPVLPVALLEQFTPAPPAHRPVTSRSISSLPRPAEPVTPKLIQKIQAALGAHPDFRPYPHRLLRQMLYSLHHAGLLDKYGETSGTTYITTHLGYIVLVALRPHETFDDKP